MLPTRKAFSKHAALLFSATLVLLMNLTGCSRADSDIAHDTSILEEAPVLHAEELPRITEPVFGAIAHVVPGDDYVFVGDVHDQTITQLDREGQAVRMFGGRGQGPDEFGWIGEISLIEGDTLRVLDPANSRYAWWALEDDAPARTRPVERAGMGMHTLPAGLILAEQPGGPVPGQGETVQPFVLSLFTKDGTAVRDSALVLPPPLSAYVVQEGRVTYTPFPFGYRHLVEVGPDGMIYHAFSEDPAVTMYSSDLDSIATVALPVERIPVTREDIRAVTHPESVNRMESELAEAVRSFAPDYWPALRDILVDDNNHLWMGLRGREGDSVRWARVDHEGTVHGVMELPWEENLHAIHGNRAYVTVMDETSGGPIVVVYEIGEA